MKSPITVTACMLSLLAPMRPAALAQTTRGPASQPATGPSSVSLNSLLDRRFATVPVRDKEKLIAGIVAGIDQLVEKENDADRLNKCAKTLQEYGCSGPVNSLEYWGENPQMQSRLRPVAEAVVKLLDKAAKIAADQATAMQNQVVDENDPRLGQWQAADQKARSARYNEIFAIYALALSLDKADPKRKDMCEKTIKVAREFDEPSSGVQAASRVCMAKLAMIASAGNPQATALLDAVIADPKTEVGDAYQARYFRAIAELQAGKPAGARKILDETRVWSKAHLAPDIQGVDAAAAALEFRIDKAEEDSATTADVKSKSRAAAVAVLRELWIKQPAVHTSIRESVPQEYLVDLKAALKEPAP